MKLAKNLVVLGLLPLFGGFALAQQGVEESVTSIPFAQELVEEDIESSPFAEEETDTIEVVTPASRKTSHRKVEVAPVVEEIVVEAPTASNAPEQKPEKPEIKLTPAEKDIINTFVFAKLASSMAEEHSPMKEELLQKFPGLMDVSIENLDSEYGINQIKAERKYKGKWLLVAGSVGKITDSTNPDIGPRMLLRGKDNKAPDIEVGFRDHEKARNELAELEAGQPISLICQVADYNGEKPVLKDCEFFNAVSLKATNELRMKLEDAVEGKGSTRADMAVAFLVLSFEKALSPNELKRCALGPEACIDAFTGLDKKLQPDEKFWQGIVDDLIKRGYTKEMFGDGSAVEQELNELFK